MAISAGSLIDNADFTTRYVIKSATATSSSIAANGRGSIAFSSFNFSPSTGYSALGIVGFALGHTNFVLRGFSDTQINIDNMGTSSATCSCTLYMLYSNFASSDYATTSSSGVAATEIVTAGNKIYANAIMPKYIREYKAMSTAWSCTASAHNIDVGASSLWTNGANPAGSEGALVLTCTTGHNDVVLRGWNATSTSSNNAIYMCKKNANNSAITGTAAQTRLFLKTAMKSSTNINGVITSIEEDNKISVNNLGHAWFIKQYTISNKSGLAANESYGVSASTCSIQSYTGYKIMGVPWVYTGNTWAALQVVNPFATNSNLVFKTRNIYNSSIACSNISFYVLYMSTNFLS